jgi:hypothetical protein
VVFRTVSEGTVLLHMEEEVYFGLNAVGGRIWELLPPECKDLDDLCARLSESYPDVEPAALREDVVELLGHLREHKLVLESE